MARPIVLRTVLSMAGIALLAETVVTAAFLVGIGLPCRSPSSARSP
jgi:hypothetical protein